MEDKIELSCKHNTCTIYPTTLHNISITNSQLRRFFHASHLFVLYQSRVLMAVVAPNRIPIVGKRIWIFPAKRVQKDLYYLYSNDINSFQREKETLCMGYPNERSLHSSLVDFHCHL